MANKTNMVLIDPQHAVLAKPAIDLATTLLKPLLQSIWGTVGKITDRAKFELFYGSLATYLENSYKRHLFFNSLVFKNEQKELEDYYLPLTLLKHPEQSETLLNTYPADLIEQYKRILIVDNAGMGKSTISKYIFLTCMRSSKSIPILIELRKLSSKKNIIDFIVESTGNLEGDTQKDLIVNLTKSGKFLFIFDGYDEISELDRTDVTKNIIEFISAAPDNKYIMTSREEGSLFSFPDFQRFTIRPLQTQEAYSLLRLYDSNGSSAAALISRLAESKNESIHEFLTNPMLTSLLFKSFEYKRTIPVRKHIFYRQVFDALFEDHDLMKEEYRRDKKSNFDIDEFDEFLRYFCFLTYKDSKFEYSKDELIAYITKTKQITNNKDLVPSHFLYDLTHGVPLMVAEGNYFKWVHRSMQEYFAAQWLCRDSKQKQKDYLLTMYKEKTLKHRNVLLMCADIDSLSFRKTVIKEIIQTLINEYDSSYQKNKYLVSKTEIEKRKQITIGNLNFIADIALNPLTPPDSNDDPIPFLNKINELLDKIGLTHTGVTWRRNDKLIFGKVDTPEISMMNIFASQRLLPFLYVNTAEDLGYEDFPMIESISDMEIVFINDNPESIVNSAKNFAKINRLITTFSNWGYGFDYKKASEMLQEINQEEIDADELSF